MYFVFTVRAFAPFPEHRPYYAVVFATPSPRSSPAMNCNGVGKRVPRNVCSVIGEKSSISYSIRVCTLAVVKLRFCAVPVSADITVFVERGDRRPVITRAKGGRREKKKRTHRINAKLISFCRCDGTTVK